MYSIFGCLHSMSPRGSDPAVWTLPGDRILQLRRLRRIRSWGQATSGESCMTPTMRAGRLHPCKNACMKSNLHAATSM
jgi:hypothetical protein